MLVRLSHLVEIQCRDCFDNIFQCCWSSLIYPLVGCVLTNSWAEAKIQLLTFSGKYNFTIFFLLLLLVEKKQKEMKKYKTWCVLSTWFDFTSSAFLTFIVLQFVGCECLYKCVCFEICVSRCVHVCVCASVTGKGKKTERIDSEREGWRKKE